MQEKTVPMCLKDKPVGNKNGLTEQVTLAETQEKINYFTFLSMGGNSGVLQRCCEVLQEELERPEAKWNLPGYSC